jgi:hypothetical protein
MQANERTAEAMIRSTRGRQLGGSLFFIMPFIQLHQERKYLVRHFLWNFIVLLQFLADLGLYSRAYRRPPVR